MAEPTLNAPKSAGRKAAEAKALTSREQRVGKGKTEAQIGAFNKEVVARQNANNDLRTQIAGTEGQRSDLQGQIDALNNTQFTADQHGTGTDFRKREKQAAAKKADFLSNSNLGELQAQLQQLGSGDAGRQAELAAGEQGLVDFRQGFNANKNSFSQNLKNAGFGNSEREQDIMAGTKLGETILGDKGLGRLQEDADIQETLGRFKSIADDGLSAQEVEAERTQLFQGADRNNQTALRGLQSRLAQSGVRGATAGNKLAQTALQGASEKNNIERDLFLKSAQAKRQGLVDFSERLGATKTFDLAQEAREKDIVLQAGLGQAQLGVSERAAKDAAAAQERAAAASSGGGGK